MLRCFCSPCSTYFFVRLRGGSQKPPRLQIIESGISKILEAQDLLGLVQAFDDLEHVGDDAGPHAVRDPEVVDAGSAHQDVRPLPLQVFEVVARGGVEVSVLHFHGRKVT